MKLELNSSVAWCTIIFSFVIYNKTYDLFDKSIIIGGDVTLVFAFFKSLI